MSKKYGFLLVLGLLLVLILGGCGSLQNDSVRLPAFQNQLGEGATL